ncbi:MAG: hypothetical protein LBQ84_06275, partial [Flavobacteriaceae bacterium]|nr:hypothetical protein [Flavobacteriaceae bacterium]
LNYNNYVAHLTACYYVCGIVHSTELTSRWDALITPARFYPVRDSSSVEKDNVIVSGMSSDMQQR